MGGRGATKAGGPSEGSRAGSLLRASLSLGGWKIMNDGGIEEKKSSKRNKDNKNFVRTYC